MWEQVTHSVIYWIHLLPGMGVLSKWNGFLANRMGMLGIGDVE